LLAASLLAAGSHRRKIIGAPWQLGQTPLTAELDGTNDNNIDDDDNDDVVDDDDDDDDVANDQMAREAAAFVADPLRVVAGIDRAFLACAPMFQVVLQTLEVCQNCCGGVLI
jgi:hypothetical protein